MPNKKIQKIAIFGLISKHKGRNQGGTAAQISRMANCFTKKGIKVNIITKESKDNPLLKKLSKEIEINTIKYNNKIGIYLKLYWILLNKNVQSIISLDTKASIIASWIKLSPRIKAKVFTNICNSIKTEAAESKKIDTKHNKKLQRIGKRVDGIIAISKEIASDYIKMTKVNKDKIKTIYNPVIDEDFFNRANQSIKHQWYIYKERPIITSVGRLVKQKDFQTLIYAFYNTLQYKQCRLIIIGDGPEKDNLKSIVHQLNVENEVDFLGFVENPLPYIFHSDIYVHSSRWEGLPGALIEALALKKPVISTNCPTGPSEILQEGKYGLLVPVGDSRKMSESIQKVLDHKEIYIPESYASNRFKINDCCEQYLEFINKITYTYE